MAAFRHHRASWSAGPITTGPAESAAQRCLAARVPPGRSPAMTAKALILLVTIEVAASFILVFGYMFAMWALTGLDG